MSRRQLAASIAVGLATSVFVAAIVELLRVRGAIPPPPSPALPTPVAPGQNTV